MRRSIAVLVFFLTVQVVAAPARAAEWRSVTLAAEDEAAAGPAWYRCFIRVPANMTSRAEPDLWSDSVTLSLAGIRGPFAVYLNGQKIAEGERLADDPRRRFKVPKGILEPEVFNVLALRLGDEAGPHGVSKPPILAGYFDELLMEGQWEVLRGQAEVDAADFKPVKDKPTAATYTESQFRQSSTPLSANAEFLPGRKLSPAESLAKMTTPDDLAVDLILAEPTVAQPTHLSFDGRGRMWVAQYRQYPYPAGLKMISRDMYYRSKFDRVPPAPPKHDRGRDIVSVHEDTDGDGKFDKNTVVLEGLNMANSALHGRGGVWVMHTPYLLFYPDADGDDVPDGDPEVRLAGFGLEDTHSVANGLAWGPDGWLYGAQGSTSTSRVTRPGVDSPTHPGVYFEGCMVWRYHPDTKVYEIFAEGGGNNFGLTFDAEGRLYSGHNGGQTRAWHFVQDGVYQMQGVEPGKYGPPRNPYAFGVLPMVASTNAIPRFTHNMVIFEGTALPPRFAGSVIGADPLHRNLVASERRPLGSSFQTTDVGVPLAGADIAFRPVYVTGGPDGAVYVADFYEEFIAHGQNYQGQIDPSTGRVYRVRGKDAQLNRDVNLAAKTSLQLVETLSHPNRWHRQTAARLLGERRDAGVVEPLKALLAKDETHPSLEALWALHQMGGFDEAMALEGLKHPAAPVRAWSIRLTGDAKRLPDPFAAAVLKLAETEADPEVRSQIACTSRRIPAAPALSLVSVLLRRDADADDPFIPLLCWWTIESHCNDSRDAVLALLDDAAAWNSVPMKRHILPRLMRRLASRGARADFLACAKLLDTAPADQHRQQLMAGFEEAFKGRALPPLPAELVTALDKSGLASPVLRVRLGDPQAIAAAVQFISDAGSSSAAANLLTTITLLGEVKVPEAIGPLLAIARNDQRPELRKAALTALLLYEDHAIGHQVAEFYKDLSADVRPAAQNLLASRPAWALSLLKLVEAGTVKPAEVPVDLVERLRAQQDEQVAAFTQKLFAVAPATPREVRLARIDRVRKAVQGAPGDPYKGEAIFMEQCAACHTLFFKGGKIGPDLTPYQREDLGTLLPSIIDPNAEVREGFENYLLRTKDGRTLGGFLTENDPGVVVIRGSDGQDVRVPRDAVKELRPVGTSLMPEGLLEGLSDEQLRDFFAYLRIPQPITR